MVMVARCLYEAKDESEMEVTSLYGGVGGGGRVRRCNTQQERMCHKMCHSRGASVLCVRHPNTRLFYSVPSEKEKQVEFYRRLHRAPKNLLIIICSSAAATDPPSTMTHDP
jgi:hypothetical protein